MTTNENKASGLDFLPTEPAGERVLEAAREIVDARCPVEFREAVRSMATVLNHFGVKAEG